jgi:hypothetical protein
MKGFLLVSTLSYLAMYMSAYLVLKTLENNLYQLLGSILFLFSSQDCRSQPSDGS